MNSIDLWKVLMLIFVAMPIYYTGIQAQQQICQQPPEKSRDKLNATGTPQNVSSFGYPNNTLPANTSHYWNVSALSASDRVCLTFLEFNLADSCLVDYVCIFDGIESPMSQLNDSLCHGTTALPTDLCSSKNPFLTVYFHTDEDTNSGRFLFQYWSPSSSTQMSTTTRQNSPITDYQTPHNTSSPTTLSGSSVPLIPTTVTKRVSATPYDFSPSTFMAATPPDSKTGLSVGAIAGITVSALVVAIIIVFVALRMCRPSNKVEPFAG